jgi:hypothetical protein
MEARAQPAGGEGDPIGARPGLGARQAAAGSLLLLMVACGFLLAAGAAAYHGGPLLRNHTPLPISLRGPLEPLKLGMDRDEVRPILILFTLGYLGILALAGSVPKRLALGTIVALHLIFMIAPPLLSSDLFNYIGYARLEVVHHINAYETPLSAAPTDPSYPFVGWPGNTTAYGPLFTLASLPLGLIGLTASVWTVKAVAGAASLGCVGLLWACARRVGRDPVPPVLFFGLNPLLLAFGVGGGHNDLLMMVPVLAGVFLLLGGEERGVLAIVGAAAVKLSGVVLLPFAVLGAKRRLRAALFAVGGIVVVAAISYAAFGTHVTDVPTVISKDSGLQTPGNVPGALLNDVLGLDLSKSTQDAIGTAVLIPVLLGLLLWSWRGADWLAAAGWATFAVLATTTWLLPWYLVWWLPLAALQRSSAQRHAALALTVLVVALELPLK